MSLTPTDAGPRHDALQRNMAAPLQSYPPVIVEQFLQRADLSGAIDAGWWGDETAYRLVESGLGGRQVRVVLERDVDLGLSFDNATGVCSIVNISAGGGAAREGRLRVGDVIRKVCAPPRSSHGHNRHTLTGTTTLAGEW
eukprot:7043901-Prymnesium_polylepis.1